jgi:hypothetical protein
MAKLNIMGRDFEIAPYKIAQMRRAAPYIDLINSTGGAMTKPGATMSIEELTEVAGYFVGFLSIGVIKVDPTITVAALEEDVGIGDLEGMRLAFTDILVESGLVARGEAAAPAPVPEATGASTSALDASSTT